MAFHDNPLLRRVRPSVCAGLVLMLATGLILFSPLANPVQATESTVPVVPESATAAPQTTAPYQTQGFKIHGANFYHKNDHKGLLGSSTTNRVKIGIIDQSFSGLSALPASEMPSPGAANSGQIRWKCWRKDSVTMRWSDDGSWSFCEFPTTNPDTHGTLVAEVIMDMVPEAELYLVNATTTEHYKDAIDWFRTNQVHIVNFSLTYEPETPGDGTTPFDDDLTGFVLDAVKPAPSSKPAWRGSPEIVWVSSGGNHAQRTWWGAFQDGNPSRNRAPNGVLEFTKPGVERQTVTVREGETVKFRLRWEDTWSGSNPIKRGAECDLRVVVRVPSTLPVTSNGTRTLYSEQVQNHLTNQNPYDSLTYTVPVDSDSLTLHNLRVSIEISDDPNDGTVGCSSTPARIRPDWIQLTFTGTTGRFTYATLEGEQLVTSHPDYGQALPVGEISHPNILSVGASDAGGAFIEHYSSRGPLPGKKSEKYPDITGVACVVTRTKSNNFCGTSAAAPHVAGIAGLLKSKNPNMTATQIANYIRNHTLPRASRSIIGELPHNNRWGRGLAVLPGAWLSTTSGLPPDILISRLSKIFVLETSLEGDDSVRVTLPAQLSFDSCSNTRVRSKNFKNGSAVKIYACDATPGSSRSSIFLYSNRHGNEVLQTHPIRVSSGSSPTVSWGPDKSFTASAVTGTAAGETVYTAQVASASGTVTYAINKGNELGHFRMNSETGAVTTAVALDRAVRSQYVLELLATVGSGSSSTSSGALPGDQGISVRQDTTATDRATLTIDVLETALAAPPAPENLNADSETGDSIRLTWDARDGIAKYELRYKLQTAGSWTSASDRISGTSYTVGGLTAATSYDFQVRAFGDNSIFDDVWGPYSATETASTDWELPKPAAPENVTTGSRSRSSISVSWDRVTGASKYRVEYRRGNTGNFTVSSDRITGTNHRVSGLSCGRTYQFRVAAHGDGETTMEAWGDYSDTATRSTSSCLPPPSAPANLTAAAGNAQVTLSWDNPNNSSISSYQYRLRTPDDSDWQAWQQVPGANAQTTSYTVTGLTNEVEYRFQIRARNSAGYSGVSVEVTAIPLPPVPAQPSGVRQQSGPGIISLTWDDPSNATITKYQYRVHVIIRGTWQEWQDMADSGASTTAYTVMGLPSGQPYGIQIRAVNAAGPGPHSVMVAAFVHHAPPAAPTRLIGGAAGPGIIDLRWQDPGNSRISSYEYRLLPSDRTEWYNWTTIPNSGATTTRHTIENLTIGKTYKIQLRAVAPGHRGEASEISVLLPALPLAPTGLAGTASPGRIALSWDQSLDATVSKYEYRLYPSNETDWQVWVAVPGSRVGTTSHEIANLKSGVTYKVELRAGNISGEGPASEVSASVPYPVPDAPTGLSATAGDGSVTLAWTDPQDPSITGYQVRTRTADASEWGTWTSLSGTNATSTTATVTGLTNGTAYNLQIRAVNPTGQSDPSAEVTATPTGGS